RYGCQMQWPRSGRDDALRSPDAAARRLYLRSHDVPQRSDQFFVLVCCSDRNANPFGQAIAFERPHDDLASQQLLEHRTAVGDVSALANESKRVGRIVEEFEIRLVENDNNGVRYARHEIFNRALGKQCAGRIVWVRNEDEPGFWRDRFQRRLQILLKIRAWCF